MYKITFYQIIRIICDTSNDYSISLVVIPAYCRSHIEMNSHIPRKKVEVSAISNMRRV